ncbi:hypothetical protein ES703_65156 [subsurface metagenome]
MEDLRMPTIARKETVTIFVNGKEIRAYESETVLAALHAAGYRILNKSKDIGEGRGPLLQIE